MSIIADAIKLSATEKELHSLDYPFKTIPAIKIAKLAVSQSAQEIAIILIHLTLLHLQKLPITV